MAASCEEGNLRPAARRAVCCQQRRRRFAASSERAICCQQRRGRFAASSQEADPLGKQFQRPPRLLCSGQGPPGRLWQPNLLGKASACLKGVQPLRPPLCSGCALAVCLVVSCSVDMVFEQLLERIDQALAVLWQRAVRSCNSRRLEQLSRYAG